jgi:hypothetical protein
MVIAADYPFLDVFWTMLVFVGWVIWLVILVRVLIDVFRRRDLSGWGKAGWTLFMIVLPILGVLSYLIVHGRDMGDREIEHARATQAQFDDHVRSVAGDGGPAAEIERARGLLQDGTITQSEFDVLKARALGAPVPDGAPPAATPA